MPANLGPGIEVYVNGIRQQEGRDFKREGDALVFTRPLAREGRLSTWRWLSMFLGIAGSYGKNETVDVIYDAGGRRVVAADLPVETEEV